MNRPSITWRQLNTGGSAYEKSHRTIVTDIFRGLLSDTYTVEAKNTGGSDAALTHSLTHSKEQSFGRI